MNRDHERSALFAQLREGAAAIAASGQRPREHSDGREKTPAKISGWRRSKRAFLPDGASTLSISAWERRGVLMLTALELATAPDGRGDTIPQWHASMSKPGVGRCSDLECSQTLACLGLTGAEEDNHHPGIARHFWMPLDPSRRVDCECKSDETVIVDPADGYKWSSPVDACAGCDYERMMAPEGMHAPCPVHKPGEKTDVHP